jgi:hypothetical protein
MPGGRWEWMKRWCGRKPVKDRIKTGNDRELVHSYPYRSACPSTAWAELVDGAAEEELLLAGYTNYFFFTQVPAFTVTLRRKLASGCRGRFLLGAR